MKIKSYQEAITYLDSLIKPVVFAKITSEEAKKRDPLARMRKLLELLDNPQNKFPSILVGGTSGKGSTAYFISHMLTTAGYKTGFTLSPHLERVNERIVISEKEITDKEFVELLDSMIRIIEAMRKMDVGEPSHFEVLIAMAFLYFACPPSLRSGAGRREQKKVDIAVVEVGLGGRWDATNTLHSLVYVLTNVSLDHTAILGDTIEKIAREKVEVVKQFPITNFQLPISNKEPIIVTGVKQASVKKIVEEKCKEVGVELMKLGKDLDFTILNHKNGSIQFNFHHQHESLKNLVLSMPAEYQVENATLAIQAVLSLQKFNIKISEHNIRKALKTAFFPGRFEIFSYKILNTKYQILFDGAHNPEKMRVFIESLQKVYPARKKIFLIAFKEDKNITEMLKEILPITDVIICTEFSSEVYVSNQKAMKASRIGEEIKKLGNKEIRKIYIEPNLKKALNLLISLPSRQAGQSLNFSESIGVVTGSLYLVGEVRQKLKSL